MRYLYICVESYSIIFCFLVDLLSKRCIVWVWIDYPYLCADFTDLANRLYKGRINMKKYRIEGHHLFEYSEKQGSYIHVYQNFRLTGQALINAYLADKIDYINEE